MTQLNSISLSIVIHKHHRLTGWRSTPGGFHLPRDPCYPVLLKSRSLTPQTLTGKIRGCAWITYVSILNFMGPWSLTGQATFCTNACIPFYLAKRLSPSFLSLCSRNQWKLVKWFRAVLGGPQQVLLNCWAAESPSGMASPTRWQPIPLCGERRGLENFLHSRSHYWHNI